MNMSNAQYYSLRGMSAFFLSTIFVVLTGAALFVFTDSANAQGAAPVVPAPASGVPKALPANHLLDVLNKAKPTLSSSDASDFSGTVKIGGAVLDATRSALQIAKLDLVISDDGALTELLRLTRTGRNTWRFGMQANQGLYLYPTSQSSNEDPDFHVANSSGIPFATFSPDTGFVGIGNTQPSYVLDTAGRIRVRGATTGTSNGGGVWFTEAGVPTTDVAYIGRGGRSEDWTGFYTKSQSAWRMVVTDSGNVGIGTTSPKSDRKLHVMGTARLETGANTWNWLEIARGSGTTYDTIYFGSDNSNRGIWSNGTRNVGIYTNGNPRLLVNGGNGNVGIGTTSFATGEKLALKGSNNTQFGIYPGYLDNKINQGWVTLEIPGVKNLRVWDNLSVAGNVGIGITSPQAKLDVDGGIAANSGNFGLNKALTGLDAFWVDSARAQFEANFSSAYRVIPVGTQGIIGVGTAISTKNETGKKAFVRLVWDAVPGASSYQIWRTYANWRTGSGYIGFIGGTQGTSFDDNVLVRASAKGDQPPDYAAYSLIANTGRFSRTVTMGGMMLASGAGIGNVLTSDAAGNATWQASPKELSTGSSGQTLRSDGSKWVANSVIFNDGTNVGIGTASPCSGCKLDVTGVVLGDVLSSRNSLVLANGSASQGAIYFGVGSGEVIRSMRSGSSTVVNLHGLDFFTNSVSRVSITNNGNVGIGTSDPSRRLTVKADHIDAPAISALPFGDGKTNTLAFSQNADGSGVQWYIGQMTGWGASGNFTLARFDDSDDGESGSVITAHPNGTVSIRPGDLNFGDENQTFQDAPRNGLGFNSNTTDRYALDLPIMQLGGYGGIQFAESAGVRMAIRDGKVGIGRTNPEEKLHVAGNLRLNDGRAEIYAQDRNHMIVLRGLQNGTRGNETSYYQYGGTLEQGLGHRFFTGGDVASQSERMRISNDGIYMSGSVGIGTTRPQERLTVLKGSRSIGTGFSGEEWTAKITNTNDTTKQNGLVVATRYGSSDSKIFEVASYWDGSREYYTPALTVTGNRNVGIGTSNPNHRLDVVGSINVAFNDQDKTIAQQSSKKIAYDPRVRGFDVAENFITDEEVSPGDIVVTSEKDNVLTKSSTPYQRGIIGIVSAAPAILFEGDQMKLAAQSDFKKGKTPPIALSGRVAVKVTREGGSIMPGDYLTTSSKPGVAMKAHGLGHTVGIALESFDSTHDSSIIVFVNIGKDTSDDVMSELEKMRESNDDLKKRLERIERGVRKTYW